MMTRTPRTTTVDVYGWEGTARNRRDAKAAAISRIEKAGKGSFCPVVCIWRGMVGFAWRERDDWSYTIARPNDPEARIGPHTSFPQHSGFTTRDEAECAMCSHLAQNGFDVEKDDWRTRPEILTDEAEWRQFRTWAHWQHRMREARQKGIVGDAAQRAYADKALASHDDL